MLSAAGVPDRLVIVAVMLSAAKHPRTLSDSEPFWVLFMNLSAWRPTFARVGVPGEAWLAGVIGPTWGSSTGAQVPHLLTAADVGHRPKSHKL